MTLLKQFATFIALFFILMVVVYFGVCVVGGAVCGAMAGAGATNPQDSIEAGRQAGASFVRNHLGTIVLSSFLVSVTASAALSFSGILPWCKKPRIPPRM